MSNGLDFSRENAVIHVFRKRSPLLQINQLKIVDSSLIEDQLASAKNLLSKFWFRDNQTNSNKFHPNEYAVDKK